jgi:predicted O-methyltransferase YrrM
MATFAPSPSKALELSTDLHQRFLDSFSDVPGWFYPESAAIWDTLLSYQTASNIYGNLLEIGVFQGKSAAMAALHRQGEETCILVDPLPLKGARQRIESVLPEAKCEYIQEMSQHLPRHAFVRDAARDFRWIHIDGEHSAQAMQNDLAIAESLLSDRGILVIDDFFSASYPQITQAVFRFMDVNPSRLMLFLCGYNKGYLCRPRAAREYLVFLKHALYINMANRGIKHITVCKTSEPSDMNTFGIIERYVDRDYRGPDWDLENIHI